MAAVSAGSLRQDDLSMTTVCVRTNQPDLCCYLVVLVRAVEGKE